MGMNEWTLAEREEFFASQDARIFSGAIATNGVPVKEVGIHVTKIVPPAQGWPIAFYCPICKETTFILSQFAAKPEHGDYWKINDVCANDVEQTSHNIEIARDRMITKMLKYPLSPKSIFGFDVTDEELRQHRERKNL